jgi:serine protease Do
MKSSQLSRAALPLLAFVLAFACTSGLTLWAADSKSTRKTERKAPAAAKEKSAPTVEKADEKRAPLTLIVDTKPINREASDRVSYAPVVKRTAASVVYVYSSKTVKAQDMSPLLNDPRFRRFFDQMIPRGNDEESSAPGGRNAPKSNNRNRGGNTAPRSRAPEQTQQGLGSGVVITRDGYIITNNHVVEDADDVKVSIGESSKRYEAKIIGRDPGTDIAVLKIEASNLSPATVGDSDQLEVGDVVLAIGNPFGVGQSVSRGIVSALGRGMGMGVFEDFIQTDAAINPGNSGGALLDSDGRVIGINSAILSRSGGFAGVGFAIPINLARSVVEQLINTGKVERGFLGVRPQELTDELTTSFGTEKGALISEVTEDSPAEKAGIKAGDVILKINATEIRDARHLLITISKIPPGTEVAVSLLRDGKTQTVQAKLARRDDEALARDEGGKGAKDEGVLNGVGVGDITAEMRTQLQIPGRIKGAIITNIEADSPAAKQGLREGDIIMELDRRPCTNATEAVKLSEEIKGPKVLVLIYREGRTRYLAIDESK